MRYIPEEKPGLSHARNRAILESRGAIIAFLDDDVLVPERWLWQMLRTFEQTGADCVGGRSPRRMGRTPGGCSEGVRERACFFR